VAAKKKVWLTWMPHSDDAEAEVSAAGAALQKVGLAVGGALWNRDIAQHGWTELAGTLSDAEGADVWIVAGNREDLEAPKNRYALSLVTAMVREQRGKTLPTWIRSSASTPRRRPTGRPRPWSRFTAPSPGRSTIRSASA
jgi:hypothetical protein